MLQPSAPRWSTLGALTMGLALLAGCGAGTSTAPAASSAVSTPAASPPAVASASTASASAASSTAPAASSAAASPPASAGTAVSGTFTVQAAPSTVAYTAHETFLQQNTPNVPVGTTSVSGTLVLANGVFQPSTLTANLLTLKTDSSLRDRRVQGALDTSAYANAAYSITGQQPGATVTQGATTAVEITGNMSIHGVQKPLIGAAKVTVTGNTLVLTGSVSTDMTLFGVTPPNIGGFVSVVPQVELSANLTATKG